MKLKDLHVGMYCRRKGMLSMAVVKVIEIAKGHVRIIYRISMNDADINTSLWKIDEFIKSYDTVPQVVGIIELKLPTTGCRE